MATQRVWIVWMKTTEEGEEVREPVVFGSKADAEDFAEALLREEWAMMEDWDKTENDGSCKPVPAYPGKWRAAQKWLTDFCGRSYTITTQTIASAGQQSTT
jgi:hypothetical protein